MDADNLSRIFYGIKTSLSLTGFELIDANGYKDKVKDPMPPKGSAMAFYNQSVVRLNGVSFRNCASYSGGAIYMKDSKLSINGVRNVVADNVAEYEGALFLDSSKLYGRNVIFARNRVTTYVRIIR